MITGCKTKTPVSDNFYPEATERIVSNENIIYYINPVSGSDKNIGTKKDAPWKTFKRVNQLILTKGNKIEIIAPGTFRESLFLIGQGTTKHPITVQFAPGKYDFYPQNAYKSKFHISNTNDAPDSLKAVAFYLLDSENINIEGNGADIIFRGKVINATLINCSNINIDRLSFDYFRPTVSEMKVIKVGDHFADVQIHTDSKFKISDSLITWIGEGWEDPLQGYWQEFDSASQTVTRKHLNPSMMRFSEIDNNHLRIHFDKNPGLISGLTYQTRNTFRDYSAFLIEKSKNIFWKNIDIYFIHGLGFVSQFCENIQFDSLIVKPKENSGRTCSAWADILHFSGCKGDILVTNSYLSATHDDPINVHGTHLRIVDVISEQKIKVRFMHPQAFGFDAFFIGDSIEFINVKSLLPYAKNKITQVTRLNDKEFELTLSNTIPDNIQPNDVIENSTWTPNVTIKNIKLLYTPTRGILVTTKGKVFIENSEFIKSVMSAILIADDAGSWFESGYVRDVTIRNNKFIDCASPVINIRPENTEIAEEYPVHKNIQIVNNQFKLDKNLLLSAKSTGNIKFSNNVVEVNKFLEIDDLVNLKACSNVEIKGNQINKTVVNIELW